MQHKLRKFLHALSSKPFLLLPRLLLPSQSFNLLYLFWNSTFFVNQAFGGGGGGVKGLAKKGYVAPFFGQEKVNSKNV